MFESSDSETGNNFVRSGRADPGKKAKKLPSRARTPAGVLTERLQRKASTRLSMRTSLLRGKPELHTFIQSCSLNEMGKQRLDECREAYTKRLAEMRETEAKFVEQTKTTSEGMRMFGKLEKEMRGISRKIVSGSHEIINPALLELLEKECKSQATPLPRNEGSYYYHSGEYNTNSCIKIKVNWIKDNELMLKLNNESINLPFKEKKHAKLRYYPQERRIEVPEEPPLYSINAEQKDSLAESSLKKPLTGFKGRSVPASQGSPRTDTKVPAGNRADKGDAIFDWAFRERKKEVSAQTESVARMLYLHDVSGMEELEKEIRRVVRTEVLGKPIACNNPENVEQALVAIYKTYAKVYGKLHCFLPFTSRLIHESFSALLLLVSTSTAQSNSVFSELFTTVSKQNAALGEHEVLRMQIRKLREELAAAQCQQAISDKLIEGKIAAEGIAADLVGKDVGIVVSAMHAQTAKLTGGVKKEIEEIALIMEKQSLKGKEDFQKSLQSMKDTLLNSFVNYKRQRDDVCSVGIQAGTDKKAHNILQPDTFAATSWDAVEFLEKYAFRSTKQTASPVEALYTFDSFFVHTIIHGTYEPLSWKWDGLALSLGRCRTLESPVNEVGFMLFEYLLQNSEGKGCLRAYAEYIGLFNGLRDMSKEDPLATLLLDLMGVTQKYASNNTLRNYLTLFLFKAYDSFCEICSNPAYRKKLLEEKEEGKKPVLSRSDYQGKKVSLWLVLKIVFQMLRQHLSEENACWMLAEMQKLTLHNPAHKPYNSWDKIMILVSIQILLYTRGDENSFRWIRRRVEQFLAKDPRDEEKEEDITFPKFEKSRSAGRRQSLSKREVIPKNIEFQKQSRAAASGLFKQKTVGTPTNKQTETQAAKESLRRLVAALNAAYIFVPENLKPTSSDSPAPEDRYVTSQAECLHEAYDEVGENAGSEEVLEGIKARLESKESVMISALEAAALLTRFVEKVVKGMGDKVRTLFSALNLDGEGISRGHIMKILALLESPRYVPTHTSEHIFAEVLESSIKLLGEEKKSKLLLREAGLDLDLKVKYKAVAEVISRKWLVHFAFQRFFAADFKPLFTRSSPRQSEENLEAMIAGPLIKESSVQQ